MIDRRDDEAGVGERRGDIVVAAGPSSPAMRDHDERKALAFDRAVLHAGDPEPPQHRLSGGLGAGRPHGAVQRRPLGIGRYRESLDAGGMGEVRRDAEDCDRKGIRHGAAETGATPAGDLTSGHHRPLRWRAISVWSADGPSAAAASSHKAAQRSARRASIPIAAARRSAVRMSFAMRPSENPEA